MNQWAWCPLNGGGHSGDATDALFFGAVSMGLVGLLTGASTLRHRGSRSRGAPWPSATDIQLKTLTFRGEIARDWFREKYCEQLDQIATELNEAWGRAEPARRKVAIFELFDDVESKFSATLLALDDATTRAIERMRQEGTHHARDIIIRFVRQHLPPNDPNAYTEDELRRLESRRRGSIPFVPYPQP